jgi:hypothetical protein
LSKRPIRIGVSAYIPVEKSHFAQFGGIPDGLESTNVSCLIEMWDEDASCTYFYFFCFWESSFSFICVGLLEKIAA